MLRIEWCCGDHTLSRGSHFKRANIFPALLGDPNPPQQPTIQFFTQSQHLQPPRPEKPTIQKNAPHTREKSLQKAACRV